MVGEERADAILAAAFDGILIVDERGQIAATNAALFEMWKLEPTLAGGSAAKLLGAMAELVQDAPKFRALTAREDVPLNDGRILECAQAPIADGARGRVWIFRDVTAARNITELGQYVLEDVIGEGGMGIVYRAHHQLLRRPTAVKLLHPERATERAVRHFEREVQRTAQLTHPNTVVVFDYGRSSSGSFYYAMEYLDGINLAQLVDAYGPQPPGRVVRILEQAAGALAEAHALNLIHRDIKPANLMLTERVQAPDLVKVLDFGLVKDVNPEVDGDPSFDSRIADTETIHGTPRFMAPECISEAERIDPRSDIYALGALGYFLLTGKPVFETKMLALLLAEVLHTPAAPPSTRTSRAIPADLEKVIMTCLSKSPGERPVDAIELRRQLLACACAATWTDTDASAWWAEHRKNPRLKHEASEVPLPKYTAPPRSIPTKNVGIDWRTRTATSG